MYIMYAICISCSVRVYACRRCRARGSVARLLGFGMLSDALKMAPPISGSKGYVAVTKVA